MNYRVDQRRGVTPATGSVFSLFAIVDETGHSLALTGTADEAAVTVLFEDPNVAENVCNSLNEAISPLKDRIISKRKSTGKYEVETDQGIYHVEVEKNGPEATWKVILPTGDPIERPFDTKREALEAVQEFEMEGQS